MSARKWLFLLTIALLTSGCGADDAVTPGDSLSGAAEESAAALAGSRWQLVEFQSMDDAIGVTRPDDPTVYVMEFIDDGTVAMQLNCNRASGAWSAQPGADGSSGTLEFGPLAMTRAMCPPPSLDEQIARHAEFVRSYLIRDARLHLALMADAGIYVWEPVD